MKPAWDKLMKNWNKGDRTKTSLIADVDCTSDTGKPLCEKVGVEGFPTIKWGDASNLEAYEGGRDYDAMKKFAKESLNNKDIAAELDKNLNQIRKANITYFGYCKQPDNVSLSLFHCFIINRMKHRLCKNGVP